MVRVTIGLDMFLFDFPTKSNSLVKNENLLAINDVVICPK